MRASALGQLTHTRTHCLISSEYDPVGMQVLSKCRDNHYRWHGRDTGQRYRYRDCPGQLATMWIASETHREMSSLLVVVK